jgi:hypothetical protein
MNYFAQQQERQEAMEVFNIASGFSDKEREFKQEELGKAGSDALGAVQRGQEWYANEIGTTLAASPNQRVNDALRRILGTRRDSGLDSLAKHEIRQDAVYRKDTVINANNAAEKDIRLDPLGDESVETAITMARGALATAYPGRDTTAAQDETERNLRTIAIQEMVALGPNNADRAAERLELWKDRLGGNYIPLKEIVDKSLMQSSEDVAYGAIKNMFGNDYDAAIDFLNEPNSYKKLKLDIRSAQYVKSVLKTEQAEDERRNVELTNKLIKGEVDAFYELIREGNAPAARRAVDNMQYVNEEAKVKMLEGIQNPKWETSEAVKAFTNEAIRSHKIKTREELLPFLGNGLSQADYEKGLELIEKSKKFRGQLNYQAEAMREFDKNAQGTKDLERLRSSFSTTLSYLMEKEGLEQNQPEVAELGKKLMEDVVIAGATSGWKKLFADEERLLDVFLEHKPWISGKEIDRDQYFDVDILDATQDEVIRVNNYLNTVNRPATAANKRAVLERGRAGHLGSDWTRSTKVHSAPPPDRGKHWHILSNEARIGDIQETIQNIEPRKSDPLPKAAVDLIMELHAQGVSEDEIDRRLVDEINAGRIQPWTMYLSD